MLLFLVPKFVIFLVRSSIKYIKKFNYHVVLKAKPGDSVSVIRLHHVWCDWDLQYCHHSFNEYKWVLNSNGSQKIWHKTVKQKYTCHKISLGFTDHYQYANWWPASWGIGREEKQQHIRHLAASPYPFHLPFPSYCDTAEACRCASSIIFTVIPVLSVLIYNFCIS
jgi:hypothetical protein